MIYKQIQFQVTILNTNNLHKVRWPPVTISK